MTARLLDRVALREGAGGRAMRALIEDVFLRGAVEIDGVGLAALDDGAAIRIGDEWLVVTTDAHVVKPPFFPGGDIGRLAVSGTVNDLAMMGATEVSGLAFAIVLEEGFPRTSLEKIQDSVRATCLEAAAPIVTGDTKVMGKGELDGVVITTTGFARTRHLVRDNGLRPGDRLIVTGHVGDHGFAILAQRHGLDPSQALVSDTAPLNGLVRAALAAGGIRAMKDPTRGGVAGVLHEMAGKAGVGIVIDERAVPVREPVRAAAELFGIDPLVVANEGKAVIGVAPEHAEAVLAALRSHALGADAAIVGTAVADRPGTVVVETGFGRRILSEPDGELLPRIC